MIYGLTFGIVGIIYYIQTNNKLQQKYYCKLASNKDDWKISPENVKSLNNSAVSVSIKFI